MDIRKALAEKTVSTAKDRAVCWLTGFVEPDSEDELFRVYPDGTSRLSYYLVRKVDLARELVAAGDGSGAPEEESNLGPFHVPIKRGAPVELVSISRIVADVDTLRNTRTMAHTAFENFDQKTNQLYNLLSAVVKSMSEMRSGTVRNML